MENNENTFGTAQPDIKKESPFADSPYVMEHSQTVDAPVEPVEEYWTAPKKAKKEKKGSSVLAGLLIFALVVGGCGLTAFGVNYYWQAKDKEFTSTINTLHQQIAQLEEKIEENSFTGKGNSISGTPGATSGLTPGQVYAQNKKAVVAISNQGVTSNIFGQTTQTASSGTGFIISADGYIVTNYHVIEDAKTLTVLTSGGDEYNAAVVGYDEGSDFALIKIDETDLPYVTLGNSEDLIEGDQVAAIGNPLGELTNSLTVGVISAKERDVTTESSIISMLQTDAAINPGNSGGPLFNMKGEVVGIITAKYAGTDIEGLGFAIPIDDVKEMITQLLENGKISAPYMGISINNKRDGIGVLVTDVESGSPADVAGIKAGDIILSLGEHETKTLTEIDKALRNFKPNETASVLVFRNMQVVELSITFGEKNQTPENG